VEAEIMGICLDEAVSEQGSERVVEIETTGKSPMRWRGDS